MKNRNKVLVINGPNLHMLGKREVELYGEFTLSELEEKMRIKADSLGLELTHFQSNSEGEIIELVTNSDYDFLIINPAAYTHTSVAIRDAILSRDVPAIEVHLTNIYKREDFRKKSLVSDIVIGVISGLGIQGYYMALESAKVFLDRQI